MADLLIVVDDLQSCTILIRPYNGLFRHGSFSDHSLFPMITSGALYAFFLIARSSHGRASRSMLEGNMASDHEPCR